MTRVALVTGAARGIGAAIAAALARRGDRVLAPTRTELDLADETSIARYVAASTREPIDILVNNAGINELRALDEIDAETWSRMLRVNVEGPLTLTRGLVVGMRARGWGRIVNISSIFGLVTKERRGMYSAAKAALNALTRTMAVEYGRAGVLVNALCPGYVETELTRRNNTPQDLERIRAAIPVGRLATPDEIAEVACFLASDANAYVTGQAIVVDGGFTCL